MSGISFSSLASIAFLDASPSLALLGLCSLISWVIIIERFIYFHTHSQNPLQTVRDFLGKYHSQSIAKKKNEKPALAVATKGLPLVENLRATEYVLGECMHFYRQGAKVSLAKPKQKKRLTDTSHFEETKARAMAEKIPEIERYLGVQATLATVSPYIGLLGTVFGIVRAFSHLGSPLSEAGIQNQELNAGIAQALVATAAGLIVAIPATISYNYYKRRVDAMLRDMEVAVAYLKSHLLGHAKII